MKYRIELDLGELELLNAIMTEQANQYKDLRIQMLYRKVYGKTAVAHNTLPKQTEQA
jgi:hypothetical protein